MTRGDARSSRTSSISSDLPTRPWSSVRQLRKSPASSRTISSTRSLICLPTLERSFLLGTYLLDTVYLHASLQNTTNLNIWYIPHLHMAHLCTTRLYMTLLDTAYLHTVHLHKAYLTISIFPRQVRRWQHAADVPQWPGVVSCTTVRCDRSQR